MMLTKRVQVYLADEFHEIASDFLYRSWHLSSYLSRRARELKLRSDLFGDVFIKGVPGEGYAEIDDRALCCMVPFDRDRYLGLAEKDWSEFFAGMFDAGFDVASDHFAIPLTELRDELAGLRRIGFRNEWVHSSKSLGRSGLRASLKCSIDVREFTLTLELERAGESLARKRIMRTLPDDIFFAGRFKDVVLEGDVLKVRGPAERVIGEMRIARFL